jgi:hypothetical protein
VSSLTVSPLDFRQKRKRPTPDQRPITIKVETKAETKNSGSESETSIGDARELSEGEWQQLQQQLKPCSRCERTFFEHRLAKHENNCKGDLKRSKALATKSKLNKR